jgi:hypothetical protein
VETTTTCADEELDVDDDDDEDEPDDVPVVALERPLAEDEPPVDDVPLLEGVVLLEDVLDPVTCWPTVKSTDATVPVMAEVKVASESEVCALVTCVSADAIVALSEAICADDAPSSSSVDSWAWSLARVAWAWVSAAANEVSSMVARA